MNLKCGTIDIYQKNFFQWVTLTLFLNRFRWIFSNIMQTDWLLSRIDYLLEFHGIGNIIYQLKTLKGKIYKFVIYSKFVQFAASLSKFSWIF